MKEQNQKEEMKFTLNTRLRDLIDGFFCKDTPENRMESHRMAEIKKGQIASEFVKVLYREGLTVSEAIGILKEAEIDIMQSRFLGDDSGN